MKYIIRYTNKKSGAVDYWSAGESSCPTIFWKDAEVFTDPEHFYKLAKDVADTWEISMERIFEPHVAQDELMDLVSL